ncbi:DNA oxidative demethylase AlkB [Marinobacterium sp. YM272]|uniref:DNA oxidative demethylase AlkB n=1 Tax=Marinobacterium sp. YM272 TaxID=3421654 RepID=UPI003D7FEA22
MTGDLFGSLNRIDIETDAVLIKAYAAAHTDWVLTELRGILRQAPLRSMRVPGGHSMSVRTSSCGEYGWVTDETGYRYVRQDPVTGLPWPAMPKSMLELAQRGALDTGFAGFAPDSCLINCYRPGARMGLHQDRDECDFSQPILSLSFGLPATFLFGGQRRRDPVKRFPLEHGDLLVWGGVSRMVYHGVAPLARATHPQLGELRLNLTFRRAG